MEKRVVSKNLKLIRDSFDITTKELPDKVGFLEKRPGKKEFRQITYKEFRQNVTSIGAALIEKLGNANINVDTEGKEPGEGGPEKEGP